MSVAEHTAAIKQTARTLGFDACHIADAAAPIDPEDRLGAWLGAGYHADMAWMARSKAVRQDLDQRLPGVQSVIVVARNYHQPRPKQPPGTGRVARYAWGRDYHRALRKPLRALAGVVEAQQPGCDCWCTIDSGPALERAWAARAGLGWIGKNSLVLRRDLGSWFFLGLVATTARLLPDTPMDDYCGTCTRCLDACPTGAFPEPGVVDSRRCISYHTIENRGDVPQALADQFEDWVFGCDICQEVCPWNRFAPETDHPDFTPRPGVAHPDLQALAHSAPETFDAVFNGTPVKRAKHAGMQRNARIALRNRGEAL